MTRSEWKNLNEDVKRGCFVAFTQEQKIEFWRDKFNEILELNWNQEAVDCFYYILVMGVVMVYRK